MCANNVENSGAKFCAKTDAKMDGKFFKSNKDLEVNENV